MNRIRKALLVLFATIFGTGCHEQSDSVSLGEIIERNTDAMGGRGAIEAVQSIQIELHIEDPSFEVDGTYYAMRPGKMRIELARKASMFSPKPLMASTAGNGKVKVSRSRRLKKLLRL
jgi:hypothetical protein